MFSVTLIYLGTYKVKIVHSLDTALAYARFLGRVYYDNELPPTNAIIFIKAIV